MSSPSSLALLGLINPRGQRPSFLIPVFGKAEDGWLQDVGQDGRIIGFIRCDSPTDNLISGPSRMVNAGELPIYGFEFESGEIVVGTKEELIEPLRSGLSNLSRHPFIRVEVCDFLGDTRERDIAVREAAVVLSGAAPHAAVEWERNNMTRNTSPPALSLGNRVLSRGHSEYGFGIVKLLEEDAFGEVRCLVAFEHIAGTLPCPPSELEVVGEPIEDLSKGDAGDVAIFARKLAAALIVQENNRAGNFMRTAVEPLPHQAYLLEKVWGRDQFGHLIADDVGLGKTIEAGLILTSLLQKKKDAKILVICPAGVALQWQDEMDEHFAHYFSVLGRNEDFSGKTAQSWYGRNLVIAPIDRIKREDYRSVLAAAGPFDLVVCDEAHRLTAKRDFIGDHLRTTANYRLIRDLVDSHVIEFVPSPDGTPRSPRLLLLTATPHQGDDLRFAYLLSLIRPDAIPEPEEYAETAIPFEILQECVSRTAKSQAVDWERKPLFQGHRTTTIEIHWSDAEREVSGALSNYIQTAFRSSDGGGVSALVLLLITHTFHKLAASSWTALHSALASRLRKLRGEKGPTPGKREEGSLDENEAEVEQAIAEPDLLFEDEASALGRLVAKIEAIELDSKWAGCSELLKKLDAHWHEGKVLMFTQYKATQTALVDNLNGLFPRVEIVQLNGDMSLEERKAARIKFEGTARFLVSTEAGGEGINLHRKCHLMINYDAAWNPMRMQQRIGRLDRYGQKSLVEVYNLRVPESWDYHVFARIEERLASIQKTMGVITDQAEDYREMILGAIAESLDEGKMFAEYQRSGTLNDARIDEIIQQAIGSAEKWRSLLRGDLGFSSEARMRRPVLTPKHFEQTYALLLDGHGVRMQRTQLPDKRLVPGVFHFAPPPQFREPSVRATQERYVVFDRALFGEVRGQVLKKARGQAVTASLTGFGDPFTDWLFERAFEARRQESAFSISPAGNAWTLGSGVVMVAGLRWLGTARRIKAPDSVVGCFLPDGGSQWVKLDENQMIGLALGSEGAPAEPIRVDPSPAKKLVQAELRSLVEAHNPQARAGADWSWLLAARVHSHQ